MRKDLVYDLPTRIFHWLFAGMFVGAFLIGKTVDDESIWFPYHMLIGLTLGFLVLLRIVWGLIGTRYARFTSFALKPSQLVAYFKGILTGDKTRWAGHNPASSWAAIVMMILALSLGVTGLLMTGASYGESLKEVHELLAHGFLVVALLHVGGVILHSVRHQDMIGLSMLDGKKAAVGPGETIPQTRPVVGLVLLAVIGAFALHLYQNYDTTTRNLNFLGTNLTLGEQDEGDGESDEHGNEEHEDDDD